MHISTPSFRLKMTLFPLSPFSKLKFFLHRHIYFSILMTLHFYNLYNVHVFHSQIDSKNEKMFFFVYIYICSDLDMTLNCMLTLCFHNAFPPSDPGSDSSNLLAHWNSLLHSDRGWGDRGQHQPTYILQIINKKPKGYIAHLRSSSLFYTSF